MFKLFISSSLLFSIATASFAELQISEKVRPQVKSVVNAEIERLPEVWCDSRVKSMSVNVQFIFYRNKKGDVLVRILHSERDIRIPVKSDNYPFYRWEDLRNYCLAQCEPNAR